MLLIQVKIILRPYLKNVCAYQGKYGILLGVRKSKTGFTNILLYTWESSATSSSCFYVFHSFSMKWKDECVTVYTQMHEIEMCYIQVDRTVNYLSINRRKQ